MVLLLDPGKPSRQPDHLRKRRNNERQYLFDVAFGADSTQEEVYLKTTKPLVDSVLQGYNATVFAYGATGSGKTYTMVGQPNNPGSMARALNDLFEAVDNTEDVVFKVPIQLCHGKMTLCTNIVISNGKLVELVTKEMPNSDCMIYILEYPSITKMMERARKCWSYHIWTDFTRAFIRCLQKLKKPMVSA